MNLTLGKHLKVPVDTEVFLVGVGWLFFLIEPTPLILQFPWLFRGVFLTLIILCFAVKKSRQAIFNHNFSPILYVILLYFLVGAIPHGNGGFLYLYTLLKVIPLYMFGYFIGRNEKYLTTFIYGLMIGQAISALVRLPIYLIAGSRAEILEKNAIEFSQIQYQGLVDADSGLSEQIKVGLYIFNTFYFFALVLNMIFCAYILLIPISKKRKLFLCLIFMPCILVILKSTMTTNIISLFIGWLIIILLLNWQSLYKIAGGIALALTLLTIAIAVILNSEALNIQLEGEGFIKLKTLLEGIIYNFNFIEALNIASNERLDLALISWNSFLEHPFFGVGSFWGGIGGEYLIGGHSTYADTLAQYGLLGSIPIFYLIYLWFYKALTIKKYGIYKIYRIFIIALWWVYLIGCFFNPYFLTSSLDQYIFMYAGITCSLNDSSNDSSKVNGWKKTANSIKWKLPIAIAKRI